MMKFTGEPESGFDSTVGVGMMAVPRKGHILPTPTRLNRASGGVFL